MMTCPACSAFARLLGTAIVTARRPPTPPPAIFSAAAPISWSSSRPMSRPPSIRFSVVTSKKIPLMLLSCFAEKSLLRNRNLRNELMTKKIWANLQRKDFLLKNLSLNTQKYRFRSGIRKKQFRIPDTRS
jgi:hypothetical protein